MLPLFWRVVSCTVSLVNQSDAVDVHHGQPCRASRVRRSRTLFWSPTKHMHIGCCCSCAVCIRILRFVTWSLVPVLCQKLVHLLSRSVFSGLFPGGSSAGLCWRGKVLLSSTRFRSFLFGSGINVEHVHSSGHSQVSQINTHISCILSVTADPEQHHARWSLKTLGIWLGSVKKGEDQGDGSWTETSAKQNLIQSCKKSVNLVLTCVQQTIADVVGELQLGSFSSCGLLRAAEQRFCRLLGLLHQLS